MYELDNNNEAVEVRDSSQNEYEITTRNIVGEPYNTGDRNRPEPATAAEFLEAIDAILSVPGVYSVRWEQYTPYFADGEPCEFSVNDISFRLTPEDDEEDERGDYGDGYIDSWSLKYTRERGELTELSEDHYEALKKAFDHWTKLNFDEVARRNFGDHARVTATVEGFNVEFYEHD